MSGWLVERLIELPIRLEHAVARVLYVLAKHADDDGGNCYPSFDTIEQMAQVSRTTVSRAIVELRETGLVMLERSGNGRRGARYRINLAAGMPKPAENPKNPTPDLFPETVAPVDHKPAPRKARSGSMVNRSGSMVNRSGSTTLPDSNQTQTKDSNLPPNSPPTLRVVAGTEAVQPVVTFDDFWLAYPRKEAKPRARVAWAKAVKQAEPGVIMEGLRRFQFAPELSKRPHPASWLNAERWADEQAPGLYANKARMSQAERFAEMMRKERDSRSSGPSDADPVAYAALGAPR